MKYEFRIAIDALGIDVVGGARSATIPLLKHLFQQNKKWYFLCYLTQPEKELVFPNVKQIILPLSKGLLSRALFQLIVPLLTVVNKIDLTHFIKSQASLIFSSKTIMTIYDCTIIKYPKFFSFTSRLFWRYFQPFIARKMDKIITISQDSKREIIENLNIEEEKISVIYPASQFELKNAVYTPPSTKIKQKYELYDEYLLYIGQIGLKKNLDTIIKAYKIIKETNPDFPDLFLIGPRYYQSDAGNILGLINELNLDSAIHYLGPVEKNDLLTIFQNASLLLFPSVHEGFGMPLLEAMNLGVPVIASNTSVMPEVLKNAGVLVNEFLHPKSWADKIIEVYFDTERKEDIISKGKKRAQDFSWEVSAKILAELYLDLLEN